MIFKADFLPNLLRKLTTIARRFKTVNVVKMEGESAQNAPQKNVSARPTGYPYPKHFSKPELNCVKLSSGCQSYLTAETFKTWQRENRQSPGSDSNTAIEQAHKQEIEQAHNHVGLTRFDGHLVAAVGMVMV